MKFASNYFGQPLQLSDIEQGFEGSLTAMFSFLFESCCIIDTEPPLPPGTSGK